MGAFDDFALGTIFELLVGVRVHGLHNTTSFGTAGGLATLRHTFVSRSLERGADIMTVKEQIGHSTVTVTMCYSNSIRLHRGRSRGHQ